MPKKSKTSKNEIKQKQSQKQIVNVNINQTKKKQLKENQGNKINHHKNKLYINMVHHQLEDQVIIYIIMGHQ